MTSQTVLQTITIYTLPNIPQINPFKTEAFIIRNQSIDLLGKSMDWFLYDNGLRLERVEGNRDVSV